MQSLLKKKVFVSVTVAMPKISVAMSAMGMNEHGDADGDCSPRLRPRCRPEVKSCGDDLMLQTW